MAYKTRRRPGEVRDAVVRFLEGRPSGASVQEIYQGVAGELGGDVARSSIQSYLRLGSGSSFEQISRGHYRIADEISAYQIHLDPDTRSVTWAPYFKFGDASLFLGDCLEWLAAQSPASIHAVVTDPPYGLVEYSPQEQAKLKLRKGGVWRIPPAFDGHRRSPLPRFTTLTEADLRALEQFFFTWARSLLPVLVPGANVLVASNPLVSHLVSVALDRAGLERRGEIARLVMTMRGGDRPKGAHMDFPDVSVMPRSSWEPWLLFRKPLEGRVQDNLRRWGTGGLRRVSEREPFKDVIKSSPTQPHERAVGKHPSLKPQRFLRQVVRAALPLGHGVVLDPFAGSGSTLAAAEAVGYASVGVEIDEGFAAASKDSIPGLSALSCD